MKNCIITGGSSGFGLHLSKVFSKKYNLYILARSKNKFLKLKNELKSKNKLIFLKNDLSKLKNIKQNLRKVKNVDLIILNAGTIDNDIRHKSSSTYAVNYLSNFLIIKLLKKRINDNKKRVTIINISSKMHKFANLEKISFSKKHSSWIQYANSKLMMLLFLNKLKRENKKKFSVLNFDPGWMKTNFGKNQKSLLRSVLNIFRSNFAKNTLFQERQAKKLFDISQNEINKYNEKFFDFYGIKKASKISYNINLQNELWNESKNFLKKNKL